MLSSRIPRRRFELVVVFAFALSVLTTGCKKGKANVTFEPISLPAAATEGCNASAQTLAAKQSVGNVAGALIGPMSQLTASRASELVYLTAADGSIQELDFSLNALMPTVTEVASAADLDATLTTLLGAHPAGILSGLTVLDAGTLVVVEHVSNTLLSVDLSAAMNPFGVLGFPSQTPGLVDGTTDFARFSFDNTTPTDVIASGDGRLFVADTGNHVIREIQLGTPGRVRSVAGLGVPLHSDDDVSSSGFDSPSGLAVSCSGELFVSEVGSDGHRLRNIRFGSDDFFGRVSGTVATLAGDGMSATVGGVGETASLDAPVSPLTLTNGDTLWVDSGTGILRMLVSATGVVSCPMFSDCATASGASGSFSGSGGYAIVVTMSGRLYVLDAVAQMLYLVSN